MYKAKIWHVSDGRKFPLEVKSQGQFGLELIEIPVAELSAVAPDQDHFHVFLVQAESGRSAEIKSALQKARALGDYPKLILVPAAEYDAALDDYKLISRAHLLDDGARPHSLMLAMELVLQQEYYRRIVYHLSGDLRKNEDVFDSMLKLARHELKDTKEENSALRSLVEYQTGRQSFSESVEAALGQVGSLRDREVLSLNEQLKATERLSEYREHELREARSQLDATEKALEFSRKEQLQRERIMDAMDKLRSYTETELLELFHENQELRQKLGLETRDLQ